MARKVSIWIRSIAVTLVIAMVYYFAGYRLVYSFVMHSAKEDAAFAMHHQGAITKMTLSAAQFAGIKWTEKNKEFSYNNQLYDVSDMQQSGGSYIFMVYVDKNETHWANAMNDFVKFLFPGNHDKSPNQAEGLLSAFQKEYTPLQKIKVTHTPETKTISHVSNGQICPCCLLIKPIWHPPSC